MNSITLRAAEVVARIGADDYDVDPTPPPGSEGFLTVIGWALWIVFGCTVLGIIIIGGRMAFAHQRGEAGQHGFALAMCIGGAVLAGAAATIVTFFN